MPFRLPPALVHPFHYNVKQFVDQSGTRTYRLRRGIELFAQFCLIFRLFNLQFAAQLKDSQAQWDAWLSFNYVNRHLYDVYFRSAFMGFFIYAFLVNLQMYFSETGLLFWQLAYDLMVRNVEQAQLCQLPVNRELQAQVLKISSRKKTSCAFVPFERTLKAIKHSLGFGYQSKLHSQQLYAHPLTVVPFLTVQHREKLLQLQTHAERASLCLQLAVAAPVYLGIVTINGLGIRDCFPLERFLNPGTSLLLLFDTAILGISVYTFMRDSLLLGYYAISLQVAFRGHLQVGHSMLVYLVKKYKANPTAPLNAWHSLLLANFLTEYGRMRALLDTSNRQIFGRLVFTTVACNMPVNIFLIYRLIYRTQGEFEFTVIFAAFLTQALLLVAILTPLARLNGTLYRTAPVCPAIQGTVLRGKTNLKLKWKVELLYSYLTESRLKSGVTIGPLGVITFETLGQMLTLYGMYLLVFLGLLPK